MRHHKKGRKFNLNGAHRKALFKNLLISLVKYSSITTTLSKAKELRSIIEPIINRAKINNLNNRRLIFAYIHNNYIVSKIIELGKFYFYKHGGYTRIIKKGWRKGDNAPLAYITFVDFNINGVI